MDKLIEQFFDVEVMIAVLPTIIQGMWMTLAICAVVIPMGLFGACDLRCSHSDGVVWWIVCRTWYAKQTSLAALVDDYLC